MEKRQHHGMPFPTPHFLSCFCLGLSALFTAPKPFNTLSLPAQSLYPLA